MQTPVGLMRYHAIACGLDALSCKRLWVGGVTMQTPMGLMRYRANACGLDALPCKRLWV